MKRLPAILLLISTLVQAQSAPLVLHQGNLGQIGSSDTITITGAPAFSDRMHSAGLEILLNGAHPDTWYSDQFAGNNATEGLISAITVPFTATNLQTNALSAYVRSDRPRKSNGGDVAAFFMAQANASNSNVFPLNTIGADTAGKRGQSVGTELDYNVNAADTTVNGVNAVIVANTRLTGFRNAFAARGAFSSNSRWSNGYITADGSVDLYGLFVGALSATSLTDRDSQPIGLASYAADNTRYIASIIGDHAGGIAVRAGGARGSVAFQAPGGTTNWASVNRATFVMNVPVVLKSYWVATLPRCDASLRGGLAYVIDAKSPTYNAPVRGGGDINVPVACDGAHWSSH